MTTNAQELIDNAVRLFKEEATPAFVRYADRLIEEDKAHWVADPHVEDVVGLVRTSDPNTALVVVYLAQNDFETSDAFDAGAYGRR